MHYLSPQASSTKTNDSRMTMFILHEKRKLLLGQMSKHGVMKSIGSEIRLVNNLPTRQQVTDSPSNWN